MAQTGFTPIQLYSTSTAAATPSASNLTNNILGSELAINITDGKLFYKDNANAVQVIAWKTTPTTAGGTGLTSYTAGDLPYYATGTTLSKLAIGSNGQILTSTGTAPQWTTLSGVAVTTFSAGTTGFTPNSATSGAVTLAGTLITTNGGTGLSSYTAGDLTYYASGTALTKLAIGAAGTWLGSSGSAPQWNTPAALTKTDDTNVTLTLGGNPSTALLNATSLTLGWTGTLATSRGGTGLSSFTANGVVYASSTSALTTSSNLTYSTDFTVTGGNLRSVKTSGAPAAFIHSNQGAGAVSPTVQFYRTGASSTATPNNQTVGTIRWDGLDSNAAFANFGYIALDIFTNAAGGAPSAMTFATAASGASATERMRIFASGGVSIGNTTDPGATNLSVSGNVVIATSGKGIDFSATSHAAGMTSELLADYEEGTWTPVPNPSSGTYTTYTSKGRYTKVGNLVCLTFQITISNRGTATTMVSVTGLPFTADANSQGSSAMRERVNTGLTWSLTIIENSATIDTYVYDNSTTVANGASFNASIVYRAA